jgi:hypothetical protein
MYARKNVVGRGQQVVRNVTCAYGNKITQRHAGFLRYRRCNAFGGGFGLDEVRGGRCWIFAPHLSPGPGTNGLSGSVLIP